MNQNFRRLPWLTLIKIVVGISLLVISLWGVEWDQLEGSFTQIDLLWIFAVVLVVLLSLFLRVLRSFIFIKNFGVPISFGRVVEAFFLGQAVNILLPSRGGDLLRLGYLSANQPETIPQVTASFGLEKFLDLLAMTAIGLGVAAYLPSERVSWMKVWLLPVSILAAILLLVMILWGPQLWKVLRKRISNKSHNWIQIGIRVMDKFVESSLWLRDPRYLIPAVLLTVLIWAVMWMTNLTLFAGFGFQLPIVAGGLVLILAFIGAMPAVIPGNVGPYYFFNQLGVMSFGISQESALAFAVLKHAVVILTPLIASGISMLVSEDVRIFLIARRRSR